MQKQVIAETLVHTTLVSAAQGDLEAMKACAQVGLAIYRELNHGPDIGPALVASSIAAGYQGHYQCAMWLLEEGMALYEHLGARMAPADYDLHQRAIVAARGKNRTDRIGTCMVGALGNSEQVTVSRLVTRNTSLSLSATC